MVDEVRPDSRARSGGVVRCESATGRELVSRWLDLRSEGLFVEADDPTPVGTLLTLEIEIPGERAAGSAVGRVTSVREAPSADGKPPGMGVTFIDVDDAVRASIDRFQSREAPSEARTQSPKEGAATEVERSLPIDSAAVPSRRWTRARVSSFAFLLLALTLAAGGYAYRARLWPGMTRHAAFPTASAPVAPIGTPGGSSLPPAAPGESATASTLAASPGATANVDAGAAARAQPAAPGASVGVGIPKTPTHRPARHAPKHRPAVPTPVTADVAN